MAGAGEDGPTILQNQDLVILRKTRYRTPHRRIEERSRDPFTRRERYIGFISGCQAGGRHPIWAGWRSTVMSAFQFRWPVDDECEGRRHPRGDNYEKP